MVTPSITEDDQRSPQQNAPSVYQASPPPKKRKGKGLGQRLQDLFVGKRAFRDTEHPFVAAPRSADTSRLEAVRESSHQALERSKSAIKAYEPESTDAKLVHIGLVVSA